VPCRGFDLAPIFTQFRRHPSQAHGAKDVLFFGATDALAFLGPESLGFLPLGHTENSIFVNPQTALDAESAHGDVVRFGTGEIAQGGAVGNLGNNAQIDLETRSENHRPPGRTGSDNAIDLRIGLKSFHHFLGFVAGDQNVDVAYRFHAPAVAPGNFESRDVSGLTQKVDKGLHQLIGVGKLKAFGPLGGALERLADFFNALLAESRQRFDLAGGDGFLKLGERPHAKRLVQLLGSFRSQTLEFEQLGHGGGKLLAQLL